VTQAGNALPGNEQGFRFDLNLCTGCSACELACSTENQLGWGRSWRQVITFNDEKLPSLPTYHLSLACNHCREAPCIKACPALAIRRDQATDAVLIEQQHCIGCRYCSWACPYDAPRFDERARVMGKCTWCDHRLASNLEPACVAQCPTDALNFGALRGVETVPGFPVTRARPAIRFTPLRPGRRRGPDCSWEVPDDIVESFAASRPERDGAISLRTEWPLLVFSLMASVLVGWILATLGGLERPDPIRFGVLAAVAAGASTLHLGRKRRAWRAVLNLRSSWLSREILFFSLFVGVALLFCALPSFHLAVGLTAAALAIATLVSVDRVYDCVRPAQMFPMHSADMVLTGLLVAALLLGIGPATFIILAAKLILYASRHPRWLGEGGGSLATTGWIAPALRAGLGCILPALLLALEPGNWRVWASVGIVAGEIIDRAEFYNELEIVSPRAQVVTDLESWCQGSPTSSPWGMDRSGKRAQCGGPEPPR
jgi:DMSO reductase iron-sulfur subunit